MSRWRARWISLRVIGPRMNDIAQRGCSSTLPFGACASRMRTSAAQVLPAPKSPKHPRSEAPVASATIATRRTSSGSETA
jgi:hypothetical protein